MWNKWTRFCLRAVLVYLVLWILAAYTNIFFTGLTPGNIFGLIIMGVFISYRLLCITVVPVILLHQFWKGLRNRIEKNKGRILKA